jgi:hypothetical protein
MILRLTLKVAAMVGETPAEWELLERQVPGGAVDHRATGGREPTQGRWRQSSGVAVRDEGVVPWKRRRLRPPHTNSLVEECPPTQAGTARC